MATTWSQISAYAILKGIDSLAGTNPSVMAASFRANNALGLISEGLSERSLPDQEEFLQREAEIRQEAMRKEVSSIGLIVNRVV